MQARLFFLSSFNSLFFVLSSTDKKKFRAVHLAITVDDVNTVFRFLAQVCLFAFGIPLWLSCCVISNVGSVRCHRYHARMVRKQSFTVYPAWKTSLVLLKLQKHCLTRTQMWMLCIKKEVELKWISLPPMLHIFIAMIVIIQFPQQYLNSLKMSDCGQYSSTPLHAALRRR